MATIRQIEANRRNSQKSTGPRTHSGKAASSLNSLRHGLRARTIVLPGENQLEFDQLCADLEAEWTPRSSTERFYLEQMAVSQWKLTRMEVGESHIFRQVPDAKDQVPLLDRLWRAQGRMERAYAKAHRELERLQDSRIGLTRWNEQPEPEPSPAEDEERELKEEEPEHNYVVEPDPRTAGWPSRVQNETCSTISASNRIGHN
jgi:hypothetical protein